MLGERLQKSVSVTAWIGSSRTIAYVWMSVYARRPEIKFCRLPLLPRREINLAQPIR